MGERVCNLQEVRARARAVRARPIKCVYKCALILLNRSCYTGTGCVKEPVMIFIVQLYCDS